MKSFLIFLTSLIVLVILITLETTQISFPFIFVGGLLLLVLFKNNLSFLGALILGLIADSLRVSNFGITPLIIFITFGIILLYEYYSGSKDTLIVTFLIFVSTLVYSFILSYSLFYVLLISAIVGIIFLAFNFFKNRKIQFLK